jgi:adenylylsulfate kinase
VSWAIWITGLPGSGKSAVARAAAAELTAGGEAVVVLELDEIRKVITPSPKYSETERDVVYRALIYMAAALVELRIPVIIDATAHRREWRELARRRILHFAEVQLVCPLEVCLQRERQRTTSHAPRGIYARAAQPGASVPDVDVPYESARKPELTIDTSAENTGVAGQRIVSTARRLSENSKPVSGTSPAWAIWITGLPGSGKTTLAWSAAETLAARSIPVRVLEYAAVRHELLDDGPESDATREIVHRALAYTAKLLTEAGVAVIVDATSPRRLWRDLARALIAHFAEVQLLCPRDICFERERAMRWHLGSHFSTPHSATLTFDRPELVMDYEFALHPELTLYTDSQNVSGELAEILRLAIRLHRAAAAGEHNATAAEGGI